ncbi:MAG: universal stress protein [Arenicellales bacterium]
MKKILVGVDLRAKYVWLVTRAADLARCIDGRVDLLYVSRKEPDSEQAGRRKTLEGLRDHLDEQRRGDLMVISGDPGKVLREQSRNYDIMVVGPNEPAGWRRLVEDAMAVQVIGGARCPVFIPRTEEPRTSFQRIVLGLDMRHGDPTIRLQEAGSWAAAMNARLDAAYCELNPARYLPKESPRHATQDTWHTNRDKEEQVLARMLRENVPAAARGKAFVRLGRPAKGLIELSASYDLVVVGTADAVHPSFFMSPVAVDVIREARCDVMTLPA